MHTHVRKTSEADRERPTHQHAPVNGRTSAIQAFVDTSSRSGALASMFRQIAVSPRVVAQQKSLESAFGNRYDPSLHHRDAERGHMLRKSAVGSGIVQMNGGKKTGKEGLRYGNVTGYTEEQLEEARRRTGGVSAHGTGKSGSGESGKTIKERDAFFEAARKVKAEDKESKKPQRENKESAPKSKYELAATTARHIATDNNVEPADRQSDFEAYLKRRGYYDGEDYVFSDDQVDELYALLDPDYDET